LARLTWKMSLNVMPPLTMALISLSVPVSGAAGRPSWTLASGWYSSEDRWVFHCVREAAHGIHRPATLTKLIVL